jgi:hypothetical protein
VGLAAPDSKPSLSVLVSQFRALDRRASGSRATRGDGLAEQADVGQDGREVGPLGIADRHERPADVGGLEHAEDAQEFLCLL